MKLVLLHARAQTLELLRYPSFSLPTLALPAIFFAFFGLPRAGGHADVLLASFAAYAVLSVAFFQFGVSIALERMRPWEAYLRSLPVSVATRLAARALSAGFFSIASVAVVVSVAVPTTSPSLGVSVSASLALTLLAGGVAFTLLGLALGYWLPPKGALPIANILYLTLSYAGGLWTGPTGVPQPVVRIASILPTRIWGHLLWESAADQHWAGRYWLGLVGYSVGFGALAVLGYRRDEGQRFR